jgi:type II secretory pathway pseudopilin PulG
VISRLCRNFPGMTKRGGFTLFEIMIAIFVVLLLVGLAVPSLSGVLADKRLHRSLDRFNVLVREAHERSLAEHRAYLIVWSDRAILLRPAVLLKTEEHTVIDSIPAGRNEKWQVEFPAALTKKPLPEWIFWESGVCEPLRIRFAGSNGSWAVEYSPLSALSEIVSYAPR